MIRQLIIGLTFLCVNFNHAQINPPICNSSFGVLTYGVKAGVASSLIPNAIKEIKENNRKIGIAGGVFLNFAFTDNFSIQPEILYSQEGTDAVFLVKTDLGGSQNILDANVNFSLDYVLLPLLIKWNFWDHFSLGVGPQFGILTKDYVQLKIEAPGNILGQIQQLRVDEKGSIQEVSEKISNQLLGLGVTDSFDVRKRDTEFAIIFNLEYELRNHYIINGRYSLGLTDALIGRSLDANPRNSVFSLMIGYKF